MSTIAKLRPVDSRSFNSAPAVNYYEDDDDDDDDEMDWEDEHDVPQYTDDDYSSSEDTPYQYDPRSRGRGGHGHTGGRHRTYAGSQAQPGRSLHGAFAGYSAPDQPEQNATVERLKLEMAGLRRQSQDAVSASLRLSDELAVVQKEAAQAQAALKASENRLQEETHRRMQAEQSAEEEARRRRAAEDALRRCQSQIPPQAQRYS